MARPLAAVTGATGFIGRHIVRALDAQGWDVRALARRDPIHPLWRNVQPEVVLGDLADGGALKRLVEGADAVIHAAGLVKARNAAALRAVNVAGASQLAGASRAHAPGAAFLLVSSLAAREPELSPYARSKRDGEEAVRRVLGADVQVLRPCAVYGPGDRETLALFRAAARSPVLPVLDPIARLSLVHVADVARAVAAYAGRRSGPTVALADACDEGYGWRRILTAASRAVGACPQLVRTSPQVLRVLGLAGDVGWRFGAAPMLTSGKARELLHRDWRVRPEERGPHTPPPWFDLDDGFDDTVAWCRTAGWLPPKSHVP